LQEREDSLDRETRILERSRNAVLSDLRLKQQRSEEERDAVVRDIENRQRRIRQQETSLAELTGRLEERSQRITRLRAELDQTQSEILEQRLVIEETRDALIRDAVAPESARARLEQARHDVAAYFERQRLQLFAERDKIEAAASELAERQQQFRRDRGELEQYFASREEELAARSGTSSIDELSSQIEQLRMKLERGQEAWQSERLKAERTIRSLIEQLTERERSSTAVSGTQPAAVVPRDAA
jgi:chromosome segregation ATPase